MRELITNIYRRLGSSTAGNEFESAGMADCPRRPDVPRLSFRSGCCALPILAREKSTVIPQPCEKAGCTEEMIYAAKPDKSSEIFAFLTNLKSAATLHLEDFSSMVSMSGIEKLHHKRKGPAIILNNVKTDDRSFMNLKRIDFAEPQEFCSPGSVFKVVGTPDPTVLAKLTALEKQAIKECEELKGKHVPNENNQSCPICNSNCPNENIQNSNSYSSAGARGQAKNEESEGFMSRKLSLMLLGVESVIIIVLIIAVIALFLLSQDVTIYPSFLVDASFANRQKTPAWLIALTVLMCHDFPSAVAANSGCCALPILAREKSTVIPQPCEKAGCTEEMIYAAKPDKSSEIFAFLTNLKSAATLHLEDFFRLWCRCLELKKLHHKRKGPAIILNNVKTDDRSFMNLKRIDFAEPQEFCSPGSVFKVVGTPDPTVLAKLTELEQQAIKECQAVKGQNPNGNGNNCPGNNTAGAMESSDESKCFMSKTTSLALVGFESVLIVILIIAVIAVFLLGKNKKNTPVKSSSKGKKKKSSEEGSKSKVSIPSNLKSVSEEDIKKNGAKGQVEEQGP
ncbi:unnamed protein product [Caenorhabditis auriculariae]|uniref:Uncharacterized protein n=1 Tax=Caenorhabditis auriculariae TaxID=2777116 RepID=A0A8S1HQ71_9PELO|nr:unnamed protein product [Caenorhabditis auriculariae]